MFGPIKSIVDPEVKVNGQTLELVDTFKFLGVHIDRDGGYKKHLQMRRNSFFTGITEIDRLGVNNLDVPIKIKSLLYTSLVRSKIMYGMESKKINRSSLRNPELIN